MGDKLVTIKSFAKRSDANLAKGKLAAAGIPVFVMSDEEAQVNGPLVRAAAEIHIQVPKSSVFAARNLLGLSDTMDRAAIVEGRQCPICSSERISTVIDIPKHMVPMMVVASMLTLMLYFMLNVTFFTFLLLVMSIVVFGATGFYVLRPRVKRCDDCRHVLSHDA